uniref:Transcriptional regulator n=1 Tax=Heterorhabditis bacteriophora TaxID=37862 RepID=A0A1I7X1E6_HETBA
MCYDIDECAFDVYVKEQVKLNIQKKIISNYIHFFC